MGKVKTEWILQREHNIDFKYDINVNADGEFYTMLPENAVLMFENASILLKQNPNRRTGRRGYISATTMMALIKEVEALIKEYLSTEVIYESLILQYGIQTQCSYCLDKNGDIVPNGHYGVKDENNNCQWKHGTVEDHDSNPTPYGLQVYVKPMVKRILKYKSGKTKTEFSFIHSAGKNLAGEFFKLGPNGKWLNDLCAISQIGHIKELEYSEQMAEFFVNMIKSICRLNERIKDYLEPEQLLLMANSGQKLLG